jgi:ribonuclease HI
MSKFEHYKKVIKDLLQDIDAEHLREHAHSLIKYIESRIHEESSTVLISDEVLTIYTDGACRGNPGPGAWAYIILQQEQTIEENAAFEYETTNNRMEMSAVIYALKKAKKLEAQEIHLYSDSQYVINGIEKWVSGWKSRGWKKADNKVPENVELWRELDELNNSLNVKYHWVKGHAGNKYNERADELANFALDDAGF